MGRGDTVTDSASTTESPGRRTIYTAKTIRTMWASNPVAEAVLVEGEHIVAVGSLDSLQQWGEAVIDARFANKVIVPGFVEAHTHAMAGGIWNSPYVGYYPRNAPDGTHWEGCDSLESVLDRLRATEAAMDDPTEPLLAWGLDPIYFAGERLDRRHHDSVSENRPIFVFHASGHLATVNTAMLEAHDIGPDHPAEGIPKGPDGYPNGELQEPAAMMLARSGFLGILRPLSKPASMWNFARIARNVGVTTATDLGTSPAKDWDGWVAETADDSFPLRLMMAAQGNAGGSEELARHVVERMASETDRLRFGIVKLILDGSIQGYTARLRSPGYLPQANVDNGLWLLPPDSIANRLKIFHDAGLTVHCHTNGDEALDVFLDAVESTLAASPRWDHRHTSQHCQLAHRDQFRRMASLGVAANFFTNHLWYWGYQHRTMTVGEDRAAGMNACRSALDEGLLVSFHSDAPITPMGPLHTMWCAVNRTTPSGVVLGPAERISPAEALEAATLGAARQLKLDGELGSIEPGKRVDFAILDDDPLDVDPMAIRDIGVWGTVLSGRIHQGS